MTYSGYCVHRGTGVVGVDALVSCFGDCVCRCGSWWDRPRKPSSRLETHDTLRRMRAKLSTPSATAPSLLLVDKCSEAHHRNTYMRRFVGWQSHDNTATVPCLWVHPLPLDRNAGPHSADTNDTSSSIQQLSPAAAATTIPPHGSGKKLPPTASNVHEPGAW